MRSTRGSVFSRPSDSAARSVRLRERLRRSGAMVSSRSALSRQDATSEDFLVVDVGKGKTPTAVEQLIARLEQHGLRRCLLTESDVTEYSVAPCVDTTRDVLSSSPGPETKLSPTSPRADSQVSGTSSDTGQSRAPFYYLCVPCEMRLTNVSVEPATERMLEDVHHHFSSATHREAASWMADPDIDRTLGTSPLIEDPRAYTRIHVNGMPLLLSRRPGGGDLFFPLPHEVERVSVPKVVRGAPLVDRFGRQNGVEPDEESMPAEKGLLFPSPRFSNDANYWYHPLSTLNTGCKQLVSHFRKGMHSGDRVPEGNVIRQSAARRAIRVDHIPLEEYMEGTLLDKKRVGIRPCIFALRRQMLPKGLVKRTRKLPGDPEWRETTGRRCYYIQPEEPYVDGQSFSTPNAAVTSPMWRDRCLVEANGVYRVVMQSQRDLEQRHSARHDANYEEEERSGSTLEIPDSQPTLTRELLSQLTSYMPFQQYHSVGTSIGSQAQLASHRGLISSDALSSSALSDEEVTSSNYGEDEDE